MFQVDRQCGARSTDVAVEAMSASLMRVHVGAQEDSETFFSNPVWTGADRQGGL
jgi:hypothetical protein